MQVVTDVTIALEDLLSDLASLDGDLKQLEREAQAVKARRRWLKEKIALLEQGQLGFDLELDGDRSLTP